MADVSTPSEQSSQHITALTYRTFNPATGQLLRTFDTVSDAQADDMLARAHDTFLAWRATPLAHRVDRVLTLADMLEANVERLVHQVSLEMGKPLSQARVRTH